MGAKLRFHLDESVNHHVARALEREGIDVTTSTETKLLSTDDNVQWAFAKREGRVLLTRDDDFLALAKRDTDHPGVAYWRQNGRTLGAMIVNCVALYDNLSAEEMRGRIEFV